MFALLLEGFALYMVGLMVYFICYCIWVWWKTR